MKIGNLKSTKNIILIISSAILLITFFLLFQYIRDNKLVNDIKDYIEDDIKILYITNKENYSNYPIKLFEKYDIDYMYIESTNLSKFEIKRIEKIINTKYISNVIAIFNNGKIIDAIIEYENSESLNLFLQKNNIIPEIIGDNSKIISSVEKSLNGDYTLLYFPYKYTEDIDNQEKILKEISKEYEFFYSKVEAYLLSASQQKKLNTILQISSVEDQIVILIKDKKIIGSVRGINNKLQYLELLKKFNFITKISQNVINIDYDNFVSLLNSSDKNIILISKDDCKYCTEVEEVLNEISIEYDVKVYSVNIGKLDSNMGVEVSKKLVDLGYSDGVTTPITLIVENNKLINYVIGASNKQYFVDIFSENGIIK